MSFAVLQLSPSTMKSIYPKTPFLYGMGTGFTKRDALDLLKADDGYRVVAQFNVDTMDQVYHASNIGDESVIQRIERMHSVSVGDLIVDENERVHIVAPDGFHNLGNLAEILCAEV